MDFTNTANLRTVDGYPFKVLSTSIRGDNPVAIEINGTVAYLDRNGKCAANEGYSLIENNEGRNRFVRYFNVYRNADGAFSFGTKACKTDEERRQLADSARAICAVEVVMVNDVVESCRNV